MGDQATLELDDWRSVNEALRSRDLRQALYDEGAVVMGDVLLTLHGAEHRDRRRLENRLFRREVFEHWEHHLLADTIAATVDPLVRTGRADLLVIGYRLAMSLTAHIAGIDHDPADALATDRLYDLVRTFSAGATLVHSTRDHDEVRAEVRQALDVLDRELLGPSMARRRAVLASADPPPHDVLTTLLRSADLPPEILRREMAFYLQAGAHSTANSLTHTLDQVWGWDRDHPGFVAEVVADPALLQRCMHEALRLLPASPVAWRRAVADTEVAGHRLCAGALVVLDLMAANRDPSLWGPDADRFDPRRAAPEGIAPWGLSFGAGMHACIGQELDGGVLDHPAGGAHLVGTVTRMAHAVLAAGGHPDPDDPPQLDAHSVRRHFARYPIRFAEAAA